MKFENLKKSLVSGSFAPAYLLEGVDQYLLSTSYNLIEKYSGVSIKELNVITFCEGVIDCEDVVRALNTMPVFCDKKIVHLDLRMSKKSEIKNLKALTEYLKAPNTMAILVVSLGDNDEDFGLDKKNFEVVDCNRLGPKIVEAKVGATLGAHGKTITADAMKTLMQYTLCDLSKILVECEKLVSYVGDRKQITAQDVTEIVPVTLEYQIFELTDGLAKKNHTKVYAILNDLRAKKDEFKTLPSLIYSHFRRLFQIALNKNKSTLELSKLLGVKEYAVKMSMAQVKLFSTANLKKINELCIKLDYDLKQSNISLENAVDLIVLTILNI